MAIDTVDSTLQIARDKASLGLYQDALLHYKAAEDELARRERFFGTPSSELRTLRAEISEEAALVAKLDSEWTSFREGKKPSRSRDRSLSPEKGVWSPPPAPSRAIGQAGPKKVTADRREFPKSGNLSKSVDFGATRRPPGPTRPVQAPAVAGNPSSSRNYCKPWLVPEAIVTGASGGALNANGRTAFLRYCYGDALEGPDAELIAALERDCIESANAVQWADIAGLDQAKQLLEEAVLLPLLMPEFFQGIRRPWRGILLFGPPGTGKTQLARALCTDGKATFFHVSASSLASKYRGDSEKLVRLVFEMARFYAPSVLFFDEIDAIGARRGESSEHEASRRVKAELLVQMDGMNSASAGASANAGGASEVKRVTVIAATNRPWDIDEALRRRLEKRIYIPLPDAATRRQLFEVSLRGVAVAADAEFDKLVDMTDGYSGADIGSVCRDAAMMGLRQKIRQVREQGGSLGDLEKLKTMDEVPVNMRDFIEALANVQRSVSSEDLGRFDSWMKEFGAI
jgi:katanin p60 ATPase-containing subunit A1